MFIVLYIWDMINNILKGNEKNYCMTCHHISYEYGEREPDNPDYDGDGIPKDEAQVVSPKCESTYYMIATEDEIKEHGK